MTRVPLARRNLLHNRRRLLAALAAVVFAVVLVNSEVGILAGFMANSTGFIDRLPGDVWIMAPGTPNFDLCHTIPESTLQRAGSVSGVEWAEKLFVSWGIWRTPDGQEENVGIVGLPPGGHLDLPWPVEPAEARSLAEPGAVIIDRREQLRLRVGGAGETAELMNRRFKVTGFTTGLRSFITTPYAITRFEDAAKSSVLPGEGRTSFVLVKAAPGVTAQELRDRLRAGLDHVDVLTAAEFHTRTQRYWLLGTGVGLSFLMIALLGFLVGAVVVGQVLYALVAEQRAEFGVLKAMGASGRSLCRVVLAQAGLIALAGYALGLAFTLPLVKLLPLLGTPIQLPGELLVGGFLAVLVACLSAAILPTVKMLRIEPALVFRG